MKLLGFNIERSRSVVPAGAKATNALMDYARGWYGIVREPFTGAWQRNIHVDSQSVIAYHAVFANITLIASDIAKLRVKLMQQDEDLIWTEIESASFSPVLRKPNGFQTRIQFWESYFLSKLTHGNTYVLKERDARGIVVALYVLNPDCCRPMVAADGSVWYEVEPNGLYGITDRINIPAREIIHDRMNTLFHPLCGVSPIFAAGLAATQGLRIQHNSARFFGNNSQPGGILSSDGGITPADAELYKQQWQENFGGDNYGRIAVLGGGLKFVQLSMTAADAQLIDQLKWSAEVVCGVFHVPPYKINVGPAPLNNNVQALNTEYYSQCLQSYIESAEICLDEGLGIGEGIGPKPYFGTEFDIDNLLRMDSEGQMRALKDGQGIVKVDELRARLGLPKTIGGGTVYLQQQNYSLEALAKRDALPNPFDPAPKTPPLAPEPAPPSQQLALPPPPAKGMINASERRSDLAQRILRSADRYDRRAA